MTLRAFCLLAVLSFLGGCLQGEIPQTEMAQDLPDPAQRPTVIALIDSGIDPYHRGFQSPIGAGAEQFAAALGATVAELAQEGDYDARMAADKAFWQSIEPGRLYAFAGTRVLAVSFSTMRGFPSILDPVGHGTATASLAAREAPDALIVMLQIDGTLCDLTPPEPYCPLAIPEAAAMAWAADQPWIDIISVSAGFPGSPPESSTLNPALKASLSASRLAHERGKIIVNGAGNTVTPPLPNHFAGPPWIIAAGGAHPGPRGDAVEASKGADALANYTEWTAVRGTLDGMDANSGTSLATPILAGTLGRALTAIRAQGGPWSVSPSDMRAALNASARLWSPADWDPTAATSNDTLTRLLSHSVPILTPTQAGWGYVDGSLAGEIARRVLEQDFSIPPEKAQTAAYMAQWQALREEYWRNAT